MSSVSSVEPTAQNFNPSWMRTNAAANRGGLTSGGGRVVSGSGGPTGGGQTFDEGGEDSSSAAAITTVLSTPVVSEFSYTRERLLELAPTGSIMPDALRDQLFFNENSLPLVSNTPLSDLEQFQRLQTNINSSKAMSLLSHADRASIAAGAAYGNGYSGGIGNSNSGGGGGGALQNGQSPTNRWAPKSTWTKSTPDRSLGAAVPRGGSVGRAAGAATFFGARGGGRIGGENGFGAATNGVGVAGGANGGGEDPTAAYQPKFTNLRRGGGVAGVGRGGSTSGATFNTRADALYNPNDPTDRPKAVATAATRSESDDEDGEGWSTVKTRHTISATTPTTNSERPAWARSESWIARSQQQQQANQQQQSQTPLSQWSRNNDGNSDAVWKDRNQMVASVKKTSMEHSPSPQDQQQQQHHQQQLQQQQQQSSAQAAPPENQESAVDAPPIMPTFVPNASTWSNNVMGGGMGVFYQPPPPPPPPKEEHVEFYYMDPSGTRRGPFMKDQMLGWFKAGYFADEELRVQRGEKGEYKTIGELKAANGAQTPFDYPEDVVESRPIANPMANIPPVNPQLSNMSGFPAAANPMFPQQQFGGMGMWSGMNQSSDVYSMMQSTFEQQMLAERQRMVEEHNRRLAEEAKKMAEFQEAMYRQITIQQEVSQQQLREKELALIRHREELERRDAELKQEALARKQQMENEARELEERKAALELEARRKAQMELEARQRSEEMQREEARNAAQRLKIAEEAAEKERQRLERESDQAKEQLRQLKIRKEHEEREKAKAELIKKQIEERERKAKEAAREQAELEAVWAGKKPATVSTSSSSGAAPQKVSPSGSDDSEGWMAIGEKKEVKHTKAAPWAAKVEAAPPAEKTLLEIQREEERQMRAEREQNARLKAKEQAANLGSVAAVPEKKDASWGAKTWAAPETGSSAKSFVSPFLDGPSLEASNKMALQKKNSQPKIVPPKAAPAPKPVAAPAKVATPTKTVKASPQKKKTPEETANDNLRSWFVSRFKQLVPAIDAETLYQCVGILENPNEIEDIIMSYAEDSKPVKEFVREFIKRRIAMRSALGRPDVDDLTSARAAQAAPSDSNSGSHSNSGNGGGKKKKKSTKQVLDGNILGFRGAAASDRLNKGEIDAIPSAPVNPSRR